MPSLDLCNFPAIMGQGCIWETRAMIIDNEASVTEAVLDAYGRTENPRTREILLALVRHLHGFVREVRLSEREFQEATRIGRASCRERV